MLKLNSCRSNSRYARPPSQERDRWSSLGAKDFQGGMADRLQSVEGEDHRLLAQLPGDLAGTSRDIEEAVCPVSNAHGLPPPINTPWMSTATEPCRSKGGLVSHNEG
jgi:hypothetical protein